MSDKLYELEKFHRQIENMATFAEKNDLEYAQEYLNLAAASVNLEIQCDKTLINNGLESGGNMH